MRAIRRRRKRSSSRRPASSPWVVVAKKVALWTAGVFFGATLLLRFIDPPVLPLRGFRAIQNWWTGKSVRSEWHWVDMTDIPVYVRQAVVSAEDARYVHHWGIDVSAMVSAMRQKSKRPMRGASTISMQTVKNLYLWPGRSYVRKLLEVCLTPFTDLLWGKRRTLELYLNIAEWGEGIYGIGAAAHHYYKKNVSQLSKTEAAALAAVLPNPRKLSPLALPPSARRRFARVMREMRETEVPQ